MKRCIVTRGISASGKSTWAYEFMIDQAKNNQSWYYLERDIIRTEMLLKKTDYLVTELKWDLWNWKWEYEVTDIFNEKLNFVANSNNYDGLIIADTNLNVERFETLLKTLKSLNFDVEVKEFSISFDEACKRDAQRKNGVGHSVIARQYEQWLSFQEYRRYVPNTNLLPAILVDIDGTISHRVTNRSPFDWDRVDEDAVDTSLETMLKCFINANIPLIILSGRDEICRDKTSDWLSEYEIWYDLLLMRPQGDTRSDTIVKEELFWNNVADNYNVIGVFDDRPKIANMWRKIGVKVFQVGNPYINF